MKSYRQLLFIQGPEKTATSTLNGMLNAHPGIFNLFEVYMHQALITKYGNQLLDRYPQARHFFKHDADFGVPYTEYFDHLAVIEPAFKYRYVGTKVNSMNPQLIHSQLPHKIIYTLRDVKSWVLKESIIKVYRTDLDIVIPVMDFLRFVVTSYSKPDTIKIWMEDLVLDNSGTFDRLSAYLDINFDDCKVTWWNLFGNHPDENPKSMFRLSHIHESSQIQPEKLDTTYVIKSIPFWDDVADIFHKYFKNPAASLDNDIIKSDLVKIKALSNYAPLSIFDCFDGVSSERFGNPHSKKLFFNKNEELNNKNASSVKSIGLLKRLQKRLTRIKRFTLGQPLDS